MSLASLLSISSATIQRVGVTQDTAAGQVRTYSKANRGTLPTTSTGRLNEMRGDRRFIWGEHDAEFDAVWFTTTDPQCDERDQITVGGQTFFVQAQKNPDQAGKYFRLELKEYRRGLQQ